MSESPMERAPEEAEFDESVGGADGTEGTDDAELEREEPDAVAGPESVGPESVDGDRTGHEQVDGVIDEVGTLDELPVAEHVGVFERAHDTLRRTLEAPSGDR